VSSLAKSLLRAAPTRRSTSLDCPREFLPWLGWLGVTPSDGQAELARVAFDGALPVDRELAVRIFGDIDFDNLPVGLRRVVVAVVGGRGGKTYILIALRLVFGMCVRDLSPLAPGEEAFATVVAPNDNLRQQAVNYALGACRTKPELRALLRLPRNTKPEDTPSEFGLYRPDFDRVVTFNGAVATRGGYGVRGKWHTDLALDECAFFRDSTAKVNDKDIYEAGVSRVLPGGQCILGSTPWAKAGLLYEFWRDNMGKPTTALVAHAPTLLLTPLAATRAVVETERLRNPDNAAREYDAKFMETGTTIFFESSTIDNAITDEPFTLQPGDDVKAGGDFGFVGDSSALILVATRGDTLHVFDGTEERPTEEAPLKPSQTVAAFAAKIAGRCGHLMADGHHRASIEEHLTEHDLSYLPAPTIPSESYVRARMLMRDMRIKFHRPQMQPWFDRFIQQMREVQGKPTAGGRISILHPKWSAGGHGDIAAAFVLAVWQAIGDEVAKEPPKEGSKEWAEAAKKARYERFKAEEERPHWRARGGVANAHWRRS
jgi:hypothetical protein